LEALAETSNSTRLSNLDSKATKILSAIAQIPSHISQTQISETPPNEGIVNRQIIAENSPKDGDQRGSTIPQSSPTSSECTVAAAPTVLKGPTPAEGELPEYQLHI
jgi:hypothetical protein